MITSPIKAVFFDLDGTLLDTAADLCNAINQLLRQYQKQPISLAQFRPLVHGGGLLMVARSFNIKETDPLIDTLRQEFINIYAQHLTEHTSLFSGIIELLDWLDNQAILWGVITNKFTGLAQALLAYFNLDRRCRCLIGGDTLLRKKPDPDQLIYACELCKISPSEVIYVGDVPGDILAAQRAGMRACGVTYGYHPPESNPQDWQADLIIDIPQQLQAWLERNLP